MKKQMTAAGLLFFFASTIPIALWRAYVIARLWAWFVVPLGLPAIGVVPAYGLTLVAGVLGGGIYRAATSKAVEDDSDAIGRIFGTAVLTGAALLFGWVAYQCR